jgi:SAM-dependent methyltransferase
MEIKRYTEANRLAWNEVTPIHQKARKIDLKKAFSSKGFSTLDDLVRSQLTSLPVKDKTVAQLCCNNGREALSLVNLGAKEAVGFDISDEAIKEAEELRAISGLDCRFIRTDVYDIGREFYNRFDVVFTSIGVLPWMPDLDGFFAVASNLLKDGGTLLMYESHPFIYMLATSGDKEFDPGSPAKPVYSYFKDDPLVHNDGIDYIGKSRYKAKMVYEFTVRLSDMLNAIVRAGIDIMEFNEYGHDLCGAFDELAKEKLVPLSFILKGTRRSRLP